MEIKTAKELKYISDEALAYEDKLIDINDRALLAAENGEYEIKYRSKISDLLKKKLEELGFTIDFYNEYEGVVISWYNEK